jgi:uncharacterized membrane protein YqhA
MVTDGGTPGEGQRPGTADHAAMTVMERLLAGSLLLALIPVVVLVAAGLGAFVYGVVVFVHSVRQVVRHPFPVGHHVGLFLLDIDLFLIGATLLISAVGFYELFVGYPHSEDAPAMPAWLVMTDLNDLKRRILAMIVMVLSVSFVEVVVDNPGGRQVLDLGIGVAAVIVALTVFMRLGERGEGEG